MMVASTEKLNKHILDICSEYVTTVFDSVVDFASSHNVCYPSVCLIERSHNIDIAKGFNTYNMTMIVVTNKDKSKSNNYYDMSDLAETLIKRLSLSMKISSVTVNPLADNFSDVVSGASVNFSVTVCSPICSQSL